MGAKVGEKIPDGKVDYVPYDPKESPNACPMPQKFKVHEQLKGKKVVIFGIPAAFSPVCSQQHLLGFKVNENRFKAKGIDAIYCISVNDGFVMHAFRKANDVKDKIIMLGDGNGSYTEALGLLKDYSSIGLGKRSKRYSMLVDNLIVKQLNIEDDDTQVSKSSSGDLLASLH